MFSTARQGSSRSIPTESPPSTSLRKDLIADEIYDQTYQFSPDEVARMLSPKRLKHALSSSQPSLNDFDCLIDEPVVEEAMKQIPELKAVSGDNTGWNTNTETANYDPIANFMNLCIEKCNEVYDIIYQELSQTDSRFKVVIRAQRFLPDLCFAKYDMPTGDGINDAQPLKPGFVGVNDLKVLNLSKFLCCWSLPPPKNQQTGKAKKANFPYFEIVVPGEARDNWMETVKQSATYARSLFVASPLRSFALVIAVNHKQQLLRYLIFHRGGLSASEPLNLTVPADCRKILKILLSIVLWQTPEDAGLPSFTNGHHFVLPHLLHNTFTIGRVIYQASSIRGRNTYVVRLQQLPGDALESSDIPDTNTTDNLKTGTLDSQTPSWTLKNPFQRTSIKRKRSTETSTTFESPSGSASPALQPPGGSKQSNSKGLDSSLRVTQISPKHANKVPMNPILPRESHSRLTDLKAVTPSRYIPKDPGTLEREPPSSYIIVKCFWPNGSKEEMEPDMYTACKNEFGAPPFLFSFAACFHEGQPMSNSIFLPLESENRHWPLFCKPKPDKPVDVDRRTLWITVLYKEGKLLEECDDASDLCECILHSMLGWLSAYQTGYLHRDISIGNLLKFSEPLSCSPFSALNGLHRLLSLSGPEGFPTSPTDELLQLAKKLDAAVAKYKVTGEDAQCKATFTDGDMAAYIPTYFTFEHSMERPLGTVEFMSTRLLYSLDTKERILQSPLDDLWSFFWTALWATLFNCNDRGSTADEENFRTGIRGRYNERDSIPGRIKLMMTRRKRNESYATILKQMAPVLFKWHEALTEMTLHLEVELSIVEENVSVSGYLMLFHKYAYKGVINFVEKVSESGLLCNQE